MKGQSNISMHHYEYIALCKDQSPERPILHQISSLIYPKIQHCDLPLLHYYYTHLTSSFPGQPG